MVSLWSCSCGGLKEKGKTTAALPDSRQCRQTTRPEKVSAEKSVLSSSRGKQGLDLLPTDGNEAADGFACGLKDG